MPDASSTFGEPLSLYAEASALASARLDERLVRCALQSRFFKALRRTVRCSLLESSLASRELYRSLLMVSTDVVRAFACHLTHHCIAAPSPAVLYLLDTVHSEYLDLLEVMVETPMKEPRTS